MTKEYSAQISVTDNPEEAPSSRKPPAGIHPIITHIDGSPFQDMEAPVRQLNISYEFYNDGSIEEAGSEVVAIFEIRNEDDFTIFLVWQAVSIEPFSSRHVDISWTTQDPGSYWTHNLLISGFDDPQPIGGKSVWGIEMADE